MVGWAQGGIATRAGEAQDVAWGLYQTSHPGSECQDRATAGTLILICGLEGAGKTALALEVDWADYGTVRISGAV